MQRLALATAHDSLIRAVLRSIAADHYGDDASPHADAESEYAGELVALAARELVRAVDAEPWDRQPIGWGDEQKPDGSRATPVRGQS